MMQHSDFYRLSHQAWLIGLISAAFSTAAFAAAGKIEFTTGNVVALNATGNSRSLTKGNEINAGDTIQTQDGRVQLRFSDGGYVSLQPNTEFKVEDYSFSGKPDGSEKGFFSLVKGGLRAITGAIGHGSNKSAYRVNTPVATIGIRGTEFLAQYDTKLLVKVGDGAVYLQNGGGDLTLFKGQSGEVGSDGSKPQHSDETPSVGAAGPSGGKPNQEQQQNQQTQREPFAVGELRSDDGNVCGTGNSSGGDCTFVGSNPSSPPTFDMQAEIQTQSLAGSFGNYTGSSSVSGNTVFADIDIDFSSANVTLNEISVTNSSGSNFKAFNSTSQLNTTTGGFIFTGYSTSSNGGALSANSFSGPISGGLNNVSGLTEATINFNTNYTPVGSGSVQVTKNNNNF